MVKLFVGGFPRDLEESELEEIFAEYGQVGSVKIVRDKRTGISRRFGFVEMMTPEGANNVMEALNGGSIDEEEVSVKRVINMPPKTAPAPNKGRKPSFRSARKPGFTGGNRNSPRKRRNDL